MLPPPPRMISVAEAMGVGEERMKITVDVAVGEGVSVRRVGVTVGVGEEVGIAATVLVAAAFAVWAIN